MSGMPLWIWGASGGLFLGIVGLFILLPGCTRGVQALLKRYVITFILKLLIAGIGFWLVIKQFKLDYKPIIIGFLIGYFISLFVEILPCIWKIRKCQDNLTGTDG